MHFYQTFGSTTKGFGKSGRIPNVWPNTKPPAKSQISRIFTKCIWLNLWPNSKAKGLAGGTFVSTLADRQADRWAGRLAFVRECVQWLDFASSPRGLRVKKGSVLPVPALANLTYKERDLAKHSFIFRLQKQIEAILSTDRTWDLPAPTQSVQALMIYIRVHLLLRCARTHHKSDTLHCTSSISFSLTTPSKKTFASLTLCRQPSIIIGQYLGMLRIDTTQWIDCAVNSQSNGTKYPSGQYKERPAYK